MTNTIKYLFLIVVSATFLSCNNSNTENNKPFTYSELYNVSWLIGKWQNITSDGSYIEIWEKQNDSTYSGISFFVAGTDTTATETISIEQKGNNIFFIPTVVNQNKGQKVTFNLTVLSANQFIFENPMHDFPQKITYTQISTDSFLAEISGMMNENYSSQKFPMSRVK